MKAPGSSERDAFASIGESDHETKTVIVLDERYTAADNAKPEAEAKQAK
ncbi:MAG: hypothetical protein ACOY3P_08075 [Planctomycetota bacterium]